MKRILLILATLALATLMTACQNGSSAEPPADLQVVASDGQVTVTWTAEPGVDYWLFYMQGTGLTTTNWGSLGGRALMNVSSPYVISGLSNDLTHSFAMNARKNGGAAGPGSRTIEATPRPAGRIWTSGTPLGAGRLTGIAFGVLSAGNISVAVGTGGAIFSGTSIGAMVARTNPTPPPAVPANLNAVAVSTSGFVAVGAGGTIVFSPDGLTWTAKTSNTPNDLFAVIANGAGFVAVGAAGTILTSTDGQTWALAPSGSGTTNDLYAIGSNGSRFVAVGAAATITTSTDLTSTTWAVKTTTASGNELRGVVGLLGSQKFVAVGAAGLVMTSLNDGDTWAPGTAILTNNFAAITYGSQYVAVGNAGSIYTSPDAATWTPQTSGTSNDLTAIMRWQNGYAAVGAAGTILSSF